MKLPITENDLVNPNNLNAALKMQAVIGMGGKGANMECIRKECDNYESTYQSNYK